MCKITHSEAYLMHNDLLRALNRVRSGQLEPLPHDPLDEAMREKIEQLEARCGVYVAALEQIRSAPRAGETSTKRYKRCVEVANDALTKAPPPAPDPLGTWR